MVLSNTTTRQEPYRAETIDLSTLSDDELEALRPKVEQELADRRVSGKKDALEKMRAAAEAVGMTPEELLGLASGGGKRKRGRRGQIVWRHPHDESLVYKGGKKPGWLKQLEAEGKERVKVQ
jgi:hypothetical protein